MTIKYLSKLQARACAIFNGEKGFEAFEKTIFISLGAICAGVILIVIALAVTGDDSNSMKSKSVSGVSKVFLGD